MSENIEYKCIKVEKNLSKFFEKLLKCRKINQDKLTFFGTDYRDALFITLYFVVLGISIAKIRSMGL